CRAPPPGFCSLSPSAFHSHGESVRIAQIDHRAERHELVRLVSGDEALELGLSGLSIAAELELKAIGELHLPGEALAQRESLDRAAENRDKLREARVAARKLGFASGRPAEERQLGGGLAGEALALPVNQPSRRPACERQLLFYAHFQAVGPYAAHRGAPYPRQSLERRAQLVNRCGEEITAPDVGEGRLNLGARCLHGHGTQF